VHSYSENKSFETTMVKGVGLCSVEVQLVDKHIYWDPIVLEEIDPTVGWVVESLLLAFREDDFNQRDLSLLNLLEVDELGVGHSWENPREVSITNVEANP
jgi:hypothetical protein